MGFKLRKTEGTAVIEVLHDITTSNIGELKSLTSDILQGENPLLVLKFLPSATFICSAGIGYIATLYKDTAKKNGRLALCGMSMDIAEIFERVRLSHLIKSFKTEEEAVRYVRS